MLEHVSFVLASPAFFKIVPYMLALKKGRAFPQNLLSVSDVLKVVVNAEVLF